MAEEKKVLPEKKEDEGKGETIQVEVGMEKKENKRFYLWLSLVLALLFIAFFLFKPKLVPFSSPSKQKTAPTTPTVTKAPLVSPTPSPGLSNDDSLKTIEKELEETPIDDFSQDLEAIEKDINSL